jgi:hypothetical protein
MVFRHDLVCLERKLIVIIYIVNVIHSTSNYLTFDVKKFNTLIECKMEEN